MCVGWGGSEYCVGIGKRQQYQVYGLLIGYTISQGILTIMARSRWSYIQLDRLIAPQNYVTYTWSQQR